MKSDKEIKMDDEMIARYLSGESTPEEALAMEDWLKESANKIHFQRFESAWNEMVNDNSPTFDVQTAWSKINSSINQTEKNNLRSISFSGWAVGLAASLLIIVATAVLWMNREEEVKFSTLSTKDEPNVVKLADHSVVTVFRNSLLDYPAKFKKNLRQLKLRQGEAFFEVVPDKSKPFIITTQAAEIKVVGTKFNVMATSDRTEISVKEGKVLVFALQDSVLLTGGNTGIFYKNQKANLVQNDSINNIWSYATHKLIFKDTPMKSAIRDIEKAYPCSITVANKEIDKCKLTATFDNDSLDKVVNLIAEILNLRVRKNGKDFILEGDGCP